MDKIWKLENFGKFVFFGVNLRHYSFEKTAFISSLRLLDNKVFLFQYSNPRNRSKIWQKLHKIFKNCKISSFVSFSMSIWNFSIRKTALIFSEKTTGQLIFASLNVLNILSHDFYLNFDKNCIKTSKIGKFWNFWFHRGHFGSFSSFPKKS